MVAIDNDEYDRKCELNFSVCPGYQILYVFSSRVATREFGEGAGNVTQFGDLLRRVQLQRRWPVRRRKRKYRREEKIL
jgi:hypothetical protein